MPLPKMPLPVKDYPLSLPQLEYHGTPYANGCLNWSQISLYIDCPEKYRRRYVDGVTEPNSIYAMEGTILAKVLEESGIRKVEKGKHMPLKVALGCHTKVHQQMLPTVSQWHGLKPAVVIERGQGFIRKLWGDGEPSINPVRMPNGKPGCEYQFTINLAGVDVTGTTDLVEDGAVLDYKVVSSRSSQRLKVDDSMQLGLYAVALGVPRVGYIMFDKDTGEITPQYSRRDFTRYRRWLEHTVAHVARAISLKVFPPCLPEKNSLCSKQWCHYFKDCYGAYS